HVPFSGGVDLVDKLSREARCGAYERCMTLKEPDGSENGIGTFRVPSPASANDAVSYLDGKSWANQTIVARQYWPAEGWMNGTEEGVGPRREEAMKATEGVVVPVPPSIADSRMTSTVVELLEAQADRMEPNGRTSEAFLPFSNGALPDEPPVQSHLRSLSLGVVGKDDPPPEQETTKASLSPSLPPVPFTLPVRSASTVFAARKASTPSRTSPSIKQQQPRSMAPPLPSSSSPSVVAKNNISSSNLPSSSTVDDPWL
ncbi:hypothetical protein JCM8547_008255, partial [Rhodosporidiobolus lusitaniae]